VDWQDEIFQSAPINSVQLAAQGGSDRIRYYFSGNYLRQTGIIEKSDFTRATLRLNNDYDLSNRFRLGHSLSFAYTQDERAPGVVRQLYYADPTVSPVDDEGVFQDVNVHGGSAGNPAAAVFFTRNKGGGNRLVGNLFADYDVTNDITFRSSFGVDAGSDDLREFFPTYFVSPTQRNNDSRVNVKSNALRTWLWDNTATYNYNAENHRLTVLGGITANKSYSETLGCGRVNIAGEDPSLWYCNAGASDGQTNENTAEEWAMLSYLARANYTLLDRYLFTASLRVDGSSRFGAENRYGYFPSFALGWNIDREQFFESMPGFDNLKLRASWGRTGNDKIGAYPAIPLITGNLNAVFGSGISFGAAPIALANPNVRWEETTQLNIGTDMTFLDDRFSVTADWYRRLTDGILVRVPIPGFVGVNEQPFVNAAEVRNTGLEAALTWSDAFGDVRYEIGANGATIDNEVLSLGGGREEILGGGLGNEVTFTTRTIVGEPIGSFWGFRTDGVFQNAGELAAGPRRGGEQPGDIRYLDISGPDGVPDGVITDADKTFIGSPIPDFIYGFNGSVEWKSFDVSASFVGQMGNEIFNGKKAVRFGFDNFETSYLDRWTGEGTSNDEPRVTNAGHNYQSSTRFIEDGSYFKLQTATLGFRLSEAMAAQMRVSRARLYVSGTNLFTLTDYSGYSPEVSLLNNEVISSGIDLGIYPTVRTFTVGLDLGF
jgi:TonB-linked SusC/RagA family outer membrane protein